MNIQIVLFYIWKIVSWALNTVFNPVPSPVFLRVYIISPFENTEGKGEIARNEQFLLFPQRFLFVWGSV